MSPRTSKRFVFLVRAFNDIDHMTPLIDRMLESKDISVDVFCVNWKYDYRDNLNLQYLKKKWGLDFSYLWGGPGSSILERVLLGAIDRVATSVQLFRKRFSRLNKFRKKLEFWLYSQLRTDAIFSQVTPAAVIFDWMNAEHPRNREIVRCCRLEQIPTICLPHGVWIYSNKFASVKRNLASEDKKLFYDYYPCPGKHKQYLLDRGIPQERIIELGSMRYSQKWLNVYESEITNRARSDESEGNFKLVIFLSQSVYNVNNKVLAEMISAIASLPNVEIAIKPHTRGISPEYIREIVGDRPVRICNETSSVELIAWADAAIVYGSSIAIQVLSQGKVLLYPDFVDTNTVHFADTGACWIVRSVEEMVSAIKQLSAGDVEVPYTVKDVDSFLNQIVYAGQGRRDVIADHLSLLKDL